MEEKASKYASKRCVWGGSTDGAGTVYGSSVYTLRGEHRNPMGYLWVT